MQCLTAWSQWAMEILQYSASLPPGSGLWYVCNALPHYLGAMGNGNLAVHCLTAWVQWAVQLLQCNTHRLGAVGRGIFSSAQAHQLGGREDLPRMWSLP